MKFIPCDFCNSSAKGFIFDSTTQFFNIINDFNYLALEADVNKGNLRKKGEKKGKKMENFFFPFETRKS